MNATNVLLVSLIITVNLGCGGTTTPNSSGGGQTPIEKIILYSAGGTKI